MLPPATSWWPFGRGRPNAGGVGHNTPPRLDARVAAEHVEEIALGNWLTRLDGGRTPLVIDRGALNRAGWGPRTRVAPPHRDPSLPARPRPRSAQWAWRWRVSARALSSRPPGSFTSCFRTVTRTCRRGDGAPRPSATLSSGVPTPPTASSPSRSGVRGRRADRRPWWKGLKGRGSTQAGRPGGSRHSVAPTADLNFTSSTATPRRVGSGRRPSGSWPSGPCSGASRRTIRAGSRRCGPGLVAAFAAPPRFEGAATGLVAGAVGLGFFWVGGVLPTFTGRTRTERRSTPPARRRSAPSGVATSGAPVVTLAVLAASVSLAGAQPQRPGESWRSRTRSECRSSRFTLTRENPTRHADRTACCSA